MDGVDKQNQHDHLLVTAICSEQRERAHVPFFHPPPPRDISPLLSAPPRHRRRHELPPAPVQAMVRGGSRRSNTARTASGASTSSAESSAMEPGADKCDSYSTNMTQAMGADYKCQSSSQTAISQGAV
ncbi:hypothetical protein ACQJBY_005891 [Aegilops geniculata]